MAVLYISSDSFFRIPHCETQTLGWNDEKGKAVSQRAKNMDSNYRYEMDCARKAAGEFHQLCQEIDRGLSENQPTLKTSF